MKFYKITKGIVGPWTEGQVVSDDELKANPSLGGIDRLGPGTEQKPGLNVIEETTDPGAPKVSGGIGSAPTADSAPQRITTVPTAAPASRDSKTEAKTGKGR